MNRLGGTLLAATIAAVAFVAIPAPGAAVDGVEIVVIGGPNVISDAVVEHLETCTAGTVRRIAGANRNATAAAVSADSFTEASTVYLATGFDFPDALAAGPAAALVGAPILLAHPQWIPTETQAEIDRLQPAEIVLLGGPGAIAPEVETTLVNQYPAASVSRVWGSDRFSTATAVSAFHFDPGVDVAFVATGANFPDALAGGVAAATRGGPILLTDPDELPAATVEELLRLRPKEIVVLGGTGVVSAAVADELALLGVAAVRRLGGTDRFATAGLIATDTFTPPVPMISVATGLDFPDALAATPAYSAGPLVLASDHELHASAAATIATFTGLPCDEFQEDLGPILAIGDSVMAGASKKYAPVPNLESEIPDISVDVAISRPFRDARGILAAALRSSRPPSTVIVHLGTNGPPTDQQFADLMAVAGSERRMFFVTAKLSRSWESTTNAVIRRNVDRYANALLIDWWALADPHPEWFSSDVNCRCHLWKSSARQAYINLLAGAVGD